MPQAHIEIALEDGTKLVVDGPYAWIYPRPIVTGFSPQSGPVEGGNTVTISGMHFRPGMRVDFGGGRPAQIVSLTSTQIVVIAPPY